MTGKTDSHLMRFTKTANDEWTSKGINRGYTGVIVFVPIIPPAPPADRYTLTINPGAIVSTHDNLHKAKNEFRKFLLDKPIT